nr:MAG TPA: Organic solute transporter subunit beta protein [Caudoviricetes sp.]
MSLALSVLPLLVGLVLATFTVPAKQKRKPINNALKKTLPP